MYKLSIFDTIDLNKHQCDLGGRTDGSTPPPSAFFQNAVALDYIFNILNSFCICLLAYAYETERLNEPCKF